MKLEQKILISISLGLMLIAAVQVTAALTDPKAGLWQETTTTADGVTLRKIRDTTGGDHNVCYVAKIQTSNVPEAIAVSISCVPEKP